MKKILCLMLCAVLLISFCACGKNNSNPLEETKKPAGKETAAFYGNWTVEKADYKEATDPMVVAMVSILKDRFAKGMDIEFKEDGKAVIGEADAEYSVESDLITITWDNNKNFIFKTTVNEDKIDLTVENVLDATIIKK